MAATTAPTTGLGARVPGAGEAPWRGTVVMGVAGCGKSTVGGLLAARLGVRFVDADDLHPAHNVATMAAGTPLTDADRLPWLARVADVLSQGADAGEPVVVACSALRRAYRDALRAGAGGDVAFVHLHGDRALLAERIAARADHFMPPALLDSQLATLEPLEADETGFVLDVARPPGRTAVAAADRLGGHPGTAPGA
ncbi:gluconokinase [Isoptericola dokdonensis]|uniref:Gluconokinase n=1 Tax=Isoptericola dokdonensis DS-3 TaxID=1300344 RepID=A0A168ENJ0_9MICO|nr:gluconokinase [Isoptericola dokdonensis]ANC30267.1 Thermoresistant gluconokinase [Isoptericola dokdonensis DS-3]